MYYLLQLQLYYVHNKIWFLKYFIRLLSYVYYLLKLHAITIYTYIKIVRNCIQNNILKYILLGIL